MNCPACGHENRDRAKFCEECGERFAVACTSCGSELRAAAKFCDECGASTAPGSAAPERDPRDYTPKHLADKILGSKAALEGERKQVTVLFADVKGSVDLSEQVDPEVWHGILDRFFGILAEGIHRFEGTINQYTGDGVMALFGAPIAHEDHAQRACFAALSLRRELSDYARELKRESGLSLAVRMGLNSGEVVVGKIGDDLRMDYTAQGHTVGLAARMEQLADPGKVFLAEPTARLVEGFLRLEDLGGFNVSGASEPVRVFELRGAGAMRTRLDLSRARGLSRFVGRADEMASLETALERAREGAGQVIGVVAEAGTGKSRLCFEFLEGCRARGVPVHESRGVAHGKMIPFLPVLELFRSFFGVGEEDPAETARDKIAGRLVRIDPALTESLPLVFDFLGVPDKDRPASAVDPEVRQRRLFAVAKRLIQAFGSADPVVVLVEDLHWIDGGSESFLAPLVDAVEDSRALLLVNFRPEYQADWMQRSTYHRLPLLPLSSDAIRELFGHLLGDDASVAGLPDAIHERTRGNPFFIEEVVQSLVESGQLEGSRGSYRLTTPLAELQVPDSVQAILAARIDRLGEREKRVLQTASVIGKQFERRLLREVMGLSDGDLDAALSALATAEFIHEHTLYPELEYAFKHPLTQEVAYGTLLGERRERLHAAVAHSVEETEEARPGESAALLSHHWEMAAEPLRAARWSHRAAEWAGFSDQPEAVRHWRRVRELATAAGDSDEARKLGLEGCVWILRFAWRVQLPEEERADVFREGRALAEAADDARSLARLCSAYGISKALDLEPAEETLSLIDEARELAREIDDPLFTLRLSPDWAVAYSNVGRPDESRRVTDEAVEQVRSDPRLAGVLEQSRAYALLLCTGAVALLMAGRMGEAEEGLIEARARARAMGADEVLIWAAGGLSRCKAALGDSEAALQLAREAIGAGESVGSQVRGSAYLALADAHAAAGDWQLAREAAERSMEITERGTWYAGAVVHFADSCIRLGDLDRAREALAQLETLGLRVGQRSEAERELVRARFLLRAEGLEAAERAEAILFGLRDSSERLGSRSLLPEIQLELAEIARLRDDEEAREVALREAHRGYVEIGAPRRAEALAKAHGL